MNQGFCLKAALLAAISSLTIFASQADAVTMYNVALNKPVSTYGTFFVSGWGNHTTADFETIVDGQFFERGHQWDQGTVWWDSDVDDGGQYIDIDLQGVFEITHSIIQGDDNDSYTLFYRDINTNNWLVAWDVPNYDSYGWGLQTRPNPNDNTQMYQLPSPIITDTLRITHYSDDSGDTCYSISEVQAFGTPVPEPTSVLLGLLGFGGLFGTRRKK